MLALILDLRKQVAARLESRTARGADRRAHWRRVSRVSRRSKPEEVDAAGEQGENTGGSGSTRTPSTVVSEPVTPRPDSHAA